MHHVALDFLAATYGDFLDARHEEITPPFPPLALLTLSCN